MARLQLKGRFYRVNKDAATAGRLPRRLLRHQFEWLLREEALVSPSVAGIAVVGGDADSLIIPSAI